MLLYVIKHERGDFCTSTTMRENIINVQNVHAHTHAHSILLTDYASTNKGPPGWLEEDQVASVQGRADEDVVVELKLIPSDRYDDLRFEL